MINYEIVYIISPKLEEEPRKALIEKVSSFLGANGEVESIDEWGNKKLAYPINKCSEGYYVLMNFKANPDTVSEFERNIKITEDVIRYLIIKKDEK